MKNGHRHPRMSEFLNFERRVIRAHSIIIKRTQNALIAGDITKPEFHEIRHREDAAFLNRLHKLEREILGI